jgi:hypothetical protein
VSVRSQRELLDATEPSDYADHVLPDLDLDANELALVYRARGMWRRCARACAPDHRAAQAADRSQPYRLPSRRRRRSRSGRQCSGRRRVEFPLLRVRRDHPGAALDLRAQRLPAVVLALVLVGTALLGTGAMVGLLSGAPPLRRGLRQLAIGFGAAAVTYVLGLLFGVSAG